jgi:predicted permease
MAPAGILNSFVAAIQASLSVLLVIFYGAVAARLKLLDAPTSKNISKVCVKIFLPALLLTKIGSELHAGSASRYGIILIWAFICHFVSFLIGIAAHLLFGMPDWITAAIMFNNTTSYPLLLVQSLDETGILTGLITTDETTRDAIERAKSYFLVFATVSSCMTFAIGPRLLDSEHAPESDDKEEIEDDDADDETARAEESEQTPLFHPPQDWRRGSIVFFPSQPRPDSSHVVIHDRRPSMIAKRRWMHLGERTKWWLLLLYDFLNAPLLGAILGAIIGLVPALHTAFFADTQDGGIFSAWLTASLKNVGMVFVPLPVVVAGVSLYLSMQRVSSRVGTPWLTTIFILVVRFVVWPVLSIGIIYVFAKNTGVLGDDPMLWFAMMLMPTGPPAMKLITMVEVSDADEEDEHKIAKLLTASFPFSYYGLVIDTA